MENCSGLPSSGRSEVELGVAHRLDAGVVDGLHVPAREPVADSVLEQRVAADPADDHRRRDLALAEPRHAQVAADLAGRALQALRHLGGGDLGLDADAALRELGDARLHEPAR